MRLQCLIFFKIETELFNSFATNNKNKNKNQTELMYSIC